MTLNEWGGMRLMSVEEPEPGEVGFTSVVSISVQPSPLSPQPPMRGYSKIAYACFPCLSASRKAERYESVRFPRRYS